MTMPPQHPYAVFTGALGDTATGGWFPARADVANGFVTLWIASNGEWAQHFSVPAHEVTVKSAAQRITLKVRGQSYPILAKPEAVTRGIVYGAAGTAASALDKPVLGAGVDVGRGLNQASAGAAFHSNGGPEFIAAARASGAQVSRLGYGPLLAIGCGGGLFAAIAVTVITVLILNLG